MSPRALRRSRTLHTVVASFYAGAVIGWLLHAAFTDPPAPPDPAAPAVSPVIIDVPVATLGEPNARLEDVPRMKGDAVAELRERQLRLPVDKADVEQMKGHFTQPRGTRRHEAVDILAPRHTPVRAVEDGTIAKLFYSKAGGTTIYQFDPSRRFTYYYAHLDAYAPGLRERQSVSAGDVIGYVGTTGNAPPNTPHLHFAVFELTPDKRWWEGRPIDPYLVFQK
jgi:murein DD-endopeptidase MepM/ murein hydrolase activator NlpD